MQKPKQVCTDEETSGTTTNGLCALDCSLTYAESVECKLVLVYACDDQCDITL
jgi:hypothetical protein